MDTKTEEEKAGESMDVEADDANGDKMDES